MGDGLFNPTMFAAAIVTVIAAIVGGTVQIINAFSAARDRRDAREERKLVLAEARTAVEVSKANGKKSDVLIESTAKIHELTNSTNSNLQKALELEIEKNAGLEQLLSALNADKQATAAMRVVTDAQAILALHTSTADPEIASQLKALADTLEHDRRNRKQAESSRTAVAAAAAEPVQVEVVNQPLTVTQKELR